MENSSQEGEECKIYGFTGPMESSQQRQTRLQDISGRKVHRWRHLKRGLSFNSLTYLLL